MTSIYGGLSDYIYSATAGRKGLIPMHIVRSILYAACIGIGYIFGFGLAHPSGKGEFGPQLPPEIMIPFGLTCGIFLAVGLYRGFPKPRRKQ